MTPEVRGELGWYGGAIYFSAWGSAIGLGLAAGFFPRAAGGILALTHMDPIAAGAMCVVIGHIAVFLAPTPAPQR